MADRHESALRALKNAGLPPGDLRVIQADGLDVSAGQQVIGQSTLFVG